MRSATPATCSRATHGSIRRAIRCMQRQGVAAFSWRRSWVCDRGASQIGSGPHEAMQGSQKVCPHGSARGFFFPSAPRATHSGVVPVPEAIPASFSLQPGHRYIGRLSSKL